MNFETFFIPLLTFVLGWVASTIINPYVKKRSENRAILDDLDAINHQLESIKSEFVGFNSYQSEKGKNLATKEDIKEITEEVESIKTNFATNFEVLKTELSKKVNLHKLAAEKELQSLSEIGMALSELQIATGNLRPMMERVDSNENPEERNMRHYNDWVPKINEFNKVVSKYRVFLPEALYFQFIKIRVASGEAALESEFGMKYEKDDFHVYLRVQAKASEMDKEIDIAIKYIQKRFEIS